MSAEVARTTRDVASARTPGFDVARALAVFGMVFVNFKEKMDVAESGPSWLVWLSARLDGRCATLFVVLAGVGISLRSRAARASCSKIALTEERYALFKRALILFVVGLVNLSAWQWDVLHFYGLYLLGGVLLLNASTRTLWGSAAGIVACSVLLQYVFEYETPFDRATLAGFATDALFGGLHPLFPWLAFLVLGIWLGRLDLRHPRLRRRVLLAAVAVAALGEVADSISLRCEDCFDEASPWLNWMNAEPYPARPAFILAATGTAIAATCLCVSVTERRIDSRWVMGLTATGQLAFSLYILHVLAIVVPFDLGWLADSTLAVSQGYAALFCAFAYALSVWWRRRWSRGPLEGLIRLITRRRGPAPWSGALLPMRAKRDD